MERPEGVDVAGGYGPPPGGFGGGYGAPPPPPGGGGYGGPPGGFGGGGFGGPPGFNGAPFDGQPPPPGGYGAGPTGPTNPLAIASLAVALVAFFPPFCCCGYLETVTSVVSIVLGVVALQQIKLPNPQTGQISTGSGFAYGGIFIGGLGVAFGVLNFLFSLGANLQHRILK